MTRELPGCFVLMATLAILPVAVLWLCQCGGAQVKPCSEEAIGALRELHTRAARDVIEAGECDQYQAVDDCPSYRLIETHFVTASEALCHGP